MELPDYQDQRYLLQQIYEFRGTYPKSQRFVRLTARPAMTEELDSICKCGSIDAVGENDHFFIRVITKMIIQIVLSAGILYPY